MAMCFTPCFFFFFDAGMGWTSGNKCPFSNVQVRNISDLSTRENVKRRLEVARKIPCEWQLAIAGVLLEKLPQEKYALKDGVLSPSLTVNILERSLIYFKELSANNITFFLKKLVC